MLRVDNREPEWIFQVLSEYSIPFQKEYLEVGDLVYSNVVVERKTLSDLWNSVSDKRLWDQLYSLKVMKEEQGIIPILLIEWNYGSKHTRKNAWKLKRMITGILTRCALWGISVSIYFDKHTFISFVRQIMGLKKRSISLKKYVPNERVQVVILSQFPNIGLRRAKKLMNEFHTLRNVFNTPFDKLKKVIGDVTAKKFIEVLEEEW